MRANVQANGATSPDNRINGSINSQGLSSIAAAGNSGNNSAGAALRQMQSDFVALCRNRNFVFLLGSFSIAVGMSWALLTVMGQLIEPCDYDPSIAGTSGAVLLGVGVVTSLIVGKVLEKTRLYLLAQKALIVAATAVTLLVLAVNSPGHQGLVVASCE
jgi:Na+/melibiose symporter-like transporter